MKDASRPFSVNEFPPYYPVCAGSANRHSVIILKEAMANLVDIQLIKQGVETWNRMRRENPGQRPDLSGILLGGANLCEADLHRTKLSGTYLKEADLSGAFLLEADLSETYLNEANLSGANLGGANLTGASLRRANPSGANLRMTNLVRADLAYANLEGIRNWEKIGAWSSSISADCWILQMDFVNGRNGMALSFCVIGNGRS